MGSAWQVQNLVRQNGGAFQLVVTAPGGSPRDVTFFRGVPANIQSYSSADPFGDSVCQVSFPQITIFDDIGSGDLDWLTDFADVNLYWITDPTAFGSLTVDQYPTTNLRKVLWEGFIASMEWQQDQANSSMSIQCQGALFQLDKYLSSPLFPQRPIPHEVVIKNVFDPVKRPHLRTKALKIEWPVGWVKKQTAQPTIYMPTGVKVGDNITGYTTRSTGQWDRALTSHVAGLLQVMVNDDNTMWTIRKDIHRSPVLYVRDQTTTNYQIWAGQPGVTINLTRDLQQFSNVLFASGTDFNGVEWSRSQVLNDLSTAYEPLAYDKSVYPDAGALGAYGQSQSQIDLKKMRADTYVRFDNGMNEVQSLRSAQQMLLRNMDPGFAGSVTLRVDPLDGSGNPISRYQMVAPCNIRVKGVAGSGVGGILLHVSEVSVNTDSGEVQLKVDSKFRDLLTLEETLARTRDSLTPVNMLQVGKRSVLIEDKIGPWDYTQGSGFIPKTAINFYKTLPTTESFPYPNQAKLYPPRRYPSYYVKVAANANSRRERWTFLPIRMGEKGSIRLTQVCAYDINGNVLPVQFHMSLYYQSITADGMPHDQYGPSPFIDNAFQNTDANGSPVQPGSNALFDPGYLPHESLIIGWGDGLQPAGYSPGAKTQGNPLTGYLLDETSWSWDLTNNGFFDPRKNVQTAQALQVYAAFYCEFSTNVYFSGRMYRRDPGTG